MQAFNREISESNGKIDRQLGVIASASIKRNVDAGGRPKWPKRTRSYPWPILDKTSTMRNTAESTALEWQKEGSWHVDKIFGPQYGLYHQYGTKKLPVREYVSIQQPEIQAMFKVFEDAFLRR
jgi:phage gpG-like protein